MKTLIDSILYNSEIKTTLVTMKDNYLLSHSDKIDVSITVYFKEDELTFIKKDVCVTDIDPIFSRLSVKKAKNMVLIIQGYIFRELLSHSGLIEAI